MKPYGKIYKEEIKDFRKLMESFEAGELTVPQFKGKSGGFGVYAQRGKEGFMIRLRVPCGVISKEHARLILSYMKKYDIKSIHFTSRQAIQLHDLSIDTVCNIMEDAIDHDLFTRGGGGNYPRNVSLSVLSGVSVDEVFDVTDFALAASEYFISKASTYHLPRKLKVAFSNSPKDTACATINDLGFAAVIADGKPAFRVFMAGGLGKDPEISFEYKTIDVSDVMYYIEAYVRLFMELGDYENRGKARSRYIPKRVGKDAFLACFEKHLAKVKEENEFEKITAKPCVYDPWDAGEIKTINKIAQRQKNLYTARIHPVYGVMSLAEYEKLCDFISSVKDAEFRISMDEEVYIRNLTSNQAEELLSLFENNNAAAHGFLSYSCVGVPTCQVGIQNSRKLLNEILTAMKERDLAVHLLPKIAISGCGNSCARHQAAELGFAGKKQMIDKVVTDVYEVYAGGCVGLDQTKLGVYCGTMRADIIPDFITELSKTLMEKEICFSKLINEENDCFQQLLQRFL